MCFGGASSAEKNISQQQQQMLTTLQGNYNTQFAGQNAILNNLNTSASAILNQGINQQGYSPQELSALRTQSATGTATAYQQARQATGEAESAIGGGNVPLASGTLAGINANLANSAAQSNAANQLGITTADYQQGTQNYLNAANVLGGVAGQMNPLGYATQATGAGSAAFGEANTINQENQAAEQQLMGLASSAIGGASAGLAAGFCPVQGSMYLMADGSEKSVETLVVGDKIMGVDAEPQTIEEIQSGQTSAIAVYTENGYVARNSLTHAFVLPKGGFVVAAKSLGKTILTATGPSKVVSVEPAGRDWVFNVITDGSHSYRADGVWALGVGEAERHVGMNEWAAIGDRMFKDKTKWAAA